MLERFDLTSHSEPTHLWDRCAHDGVLCSVDELAAELAEAIVDLRCGGVPGLVDSWRSQRMGTGHTTPHAVEQLAQFIGLGFGLPHSKDPMPDDHLEGSVAESLWYMLVIEFEHDDPIAYAVPPDLAPTDHGGDGFVVHRRLTGVGYRLWEIKKYTGAGTVRATVRKACKQLNDNATEYLARQIPAGQYHPDDEIRDLIVHSMERWYDGAPEASAGVAVASANERSASERFKDMDTHFDTLSDPTQLRGLVAEFTDFSDFARRVQQELWKGL